MKRVLAGILAVTMTFSGALLPGEQVWKGAGVISAAAETWSSAKSLTSDMTVSGSLESNSDIKLNNHTLTVNGDLYMTAGMLDIGTGKLVVNGNLYIGKENASSYAYIVMQNSSASITLTGDLVWNVHSGMTNSLGDSPYYTFGLISAGTINVAGNVYDHISSIKNFNGFVMSGTSVLNLNGTGIQTIKGSYNGEIANLTVTNNRTVDMEGYFFSRTALISDLNIVTQKGLKISSMLIGGKTVNITGDVTQYEQNIDLGGGTLNITGNFTAQSGIMKLNGGKLKVSGDYRIATLKNNGDLGEADAGLYMTNSNDMVTVGGSFIVRNRAASSNYYTSMTAGKMYVGGDFDCSSDYISFGSGNTVYMNGTESQTVKLTNGKKIYNLVLEQDITQYNSDVANYAVKLKTNQPVITADAVTLGTTGYTYDGTAKQPKVTVKVDSTTLTQGTDYTVVYSANTNVGTASVTVKGIGAYQGTVVKNFTINAKSVSGLTMTLSQTSYTYDGTAKKPTVTVKDGSKTLTSGTDYTVAYSNNTNVGTATVTITGKGNYSGTKSATYTISSSTKAISTCTVTLGTTSYTYDGTAKQPTVTVKDGSKTLTKGTDYTVVYSANTNAGTASVTIKGAGSYTGSVVKNFTISAKSVSGLTMTLSQTSYTYDGTAKKPTVTVKDGSKTLTSGTDYTVAYSNNTNVGTATVTITGKGNYSGTKSATYTISSATKAISTCTVTLGTTSYTYDGTAKQPAVTVKDGSKTLTKGTDYTVVYSANTNAGTASVTIKGAGSYTGSVVKNFTINAKSVSGLTITLSQTSYTYDGTAKKPTVTVKDGSKTLTSGTDYTVTYSNNTNVGTATVTITGKGNYSGTKSATYTISSATKAISTCTVTLDTTSYTYDGTAKQPAVTVKDGSKTLTKGTDYTVVYSANTNAGTASVTIKGAGSYTGSVVKNFTINAKSVSGLTMTLSQTSYTYDGTAKKPTVTVKDGSKTLTSGTDYTVAYSNNTNVGTATVTITGKGNYSGTKSANFNISSPAATPISNCTVTLGTTSYTYDGTAKKPTVTVKNGSKTLTSGTDYTVTYSNNTNVGTATVTITGKGSYSGSVSKTFTISAKSVSGMTITISPASCTYDGTAKKPTVIVADGDTVLENGTDYTVAYSSNTNAGTAKVTITGKGNYTGSASKNFTISAKDMSELAITLSASSYTYDGTAKKPSVTVKDGSKTLTGGTDYTVTYSDNTNVGTASVTITGKGNYTGSAVKTFTISQPAAVSISGCTISLGTTSYTYDGTAKKPTVTVSDSSKTLSNGTDYTVEYYNNINAGTATVTIMGMGRYTGTVSKNFTISAKNASSLTVTVSPASYVYDGTAKTPAVTVKDGTKVLEAGTDFTVSYSNNSGVGTATATITGKGNYTGTKSVNFTISEPAAVPLSSCTISLGATSYTYDGTAKQPAVTVKNGSTTLVKGTDYTVTYSNNTNAGTATVTVTGKGKYTGTVNKTFTINAKSASSLTATVSPTSYTYDGKPKTPAVTVTDGSKTLVNGVDYTVSYSANTEVGTAKANITGIGNYTGTKTVNFTISKAAPISIAKCTITLGTTSYTYDGTARKPAVNIQNGSENLVEGTDFTVTYTNNTNAGTATVTIKGIGNYNDTTTKTFTINPKNANTLTVAVSPASYTYDGKEKKPAVTVKDGTKTLTNNTDYTVAYANNTNVGTATVTITGKGNYTGTKAASFTISEPAAVSLSSCTATLGTSSYTYDGTEKKPSVTVKNGSTTLSNGVDYIVSYTDNVNAGTATVNIMGLGRYTGSITKTFTINQKSVNVLSVAVSPASYTYDGNAKKPDVTVTDGSRTLTNGKDYAVAYTNNVNAGTATVTVKGVGNYAGSVNKSFKITAKSVSELTVTLSATAFTYDGNAKQPTVTVTDGSKKLVSGTDYTVTYSNNTKIGTATVTVKGKGNYSDSKTVNFTINKAEAVNIGTCKATLNADSFVYDGMAKKPVPTVKHGDKTLRNGVDYTYDYDKNINAGTASVIVTGIGEYAGTGTLHFTISPAPITNVKIAVQSENYIYDGTEKKPSVVVTEGMKTLKEGADYVVSYGNNVEAGKARVYVNGRGNYTGRKYAEFTITAKKADSNNIADCSITLAKKSAEYTGSAITPDVIIRDNTDVLTKGVDYTVDYVSNVDAGKAKVIITGTGAYRGIYETNFTITAKAAKSLDITVSPESYEYNGTARKPKVTVKNGSRVLTEKIDYTLSYSDNIIAGNAVVNVNCTGNYSGTVTKYFKIKSSDISKASVKLEKYYYDANGSARCPSVTIEKDGRTLVENRDYMVTYSSNTSAGIAYVNISGQGNYYGTVLQQFIIGSANAKSISGFKVTMNSTAFVYDGTAKKPQVTLTNGSATLKEHQDFEVVCYNNVNAGRATLVVLGRGGYKDTITTGFTIKSKSLAGAQAALSTTSFEYDGGAKTPVVTVTADGTELVEGRDFTVQYKNNTAAGTASAVITGTGNYSGSTEKKFAIKGKNVAGLEVVLEKNEYAYSGKAITPKVKVYDGGKLLTSGTDYTVSYENNTTAGAAKVVITGKGNYAGKTSVGFAIVDKSTSKVKKGDVNGDGAINVSDITKIAAHIKGKKKLTGDSLLAADVNGDGKVNVTDITQIAAHIKGKRQIK
ncbi:MAG: MBG domain-containing protein [Ruminococcus sp.]|uniref:dockerin type I domain-containing protein n=1 Tax=Ruminococcus sp. TaxID=41978 RepID=UPI0025FA6E65|nr:dockerin type I domain-containing protein [Ruminococcus sp.]MCR5539965.1 MBG domain-containing protein [Ruminococcus sp.]